MSTSTATRVNGKPLSAATIERRRDTAAALSSVRMIFRIGDVPTKTKKNPRASGVQVDALGPDTVRVDCGPVSGAATAFHEKIAVALRNYPDWTLTPHRFGGHLVLYVTRDA